MKTRSKMNQTMQAFATIAALLAGPLAIAQNTCAAKASAVEETVIEKLPPPQHMTGIGNASIAITTSSDDARVWFTQGLNLLHDFWDFESIRSFEQSVSADPECAMCWWGLHQARSFRSDEGNRGKLALDNAKRLRKHASEPERLYIEASLAAAKEEKKPRRPYDDTDPPHKDSKETKVLRKLVTLQPNDPEAQIYLAESLLNGFHKNGEPKSGTREGQQILEHVLATHPEDSAANHYWIHAVEAGNHPELALASARKLGALAPASGHMVHMPGHIFYRTGDYESARKTFQESTDTDFAYMQAQHVKVDDDWNYVHNMMYLIADLLEAGRIAEATQVSAKLNYARGETKATLYTFSTRDGLTRLNVALPVALRAGNWTEASDMLTASKPDAALMNLIWLRGALLDYTLGMKALEASDAIEAARQRDALDAAMKAKPMEDGMGMSHPMPGMSMKDASSKAVRTFMDVAANELRASVLMAQGKSAEADAAFQKATELETALGYREPPYYIRPVSETRGDALLRAHRYPEARQAYEAALKDRPNSGYPLYGIARASAGMKDDAAASVAFGQLLAAWPTADAGLPQTTAARDWIASHPTMAHSSAPAHTAQSAP